MNDHRDLKFNNPSSGYLNFDETIEEVLKYLKEDPKKDYEIVVGCDSSSDEQPSFPVALVVLKKGYGGRFFLAKVKYPEEEGRFFTFHQRILQEVLLSCEIALSLRDDIDKRAVEMGVPNYEFQYIHADVGQNGRTKDMIKEVVGLIKSNGFKPKIKPESYAASIVADRFT